jgi:GT2 family glycosyltransferase
MVDVRVGIVSWNTAELLDACLTALPGALGALEAEVVVVDNASSDGSAAVARGHEGVRVVENEANEGYSRGMNQALAGSAAPVLIALNPDTVPPPGSLETLVRRLDAHPEAGVVVPRLVGPDGHVQHSCYRFPSFAVSLGAALLPPRAQRSGLGRRLWLEGSQTHTDSTEVDWAIGAVHVIRASVAGERPYSDRWFMYAEDLELCWRVRQAGSSVRLEGDVEVVHISNASGSQRWGGARARRYWLATYDFLAMERGALYARALAALNAALASLLIVVYRVGARAGGAVGERRSVIAGDLRASLGGHARAAIWGPPPGGEPVGAPGV